MTTITFDTLKLANRLKAGGFSAEQADTTASALAESLGEVSDLATRGDLLTVKADLKADLAETKAEILKWVLGALAAQTAFLSAIKFFGH